MNNILLIGAGQLGSRHLQGLAKSEDTYNISVLEPNAANRQIAESRFHEINGHQKHVLNTFKDFNEIPKQLYSIAIIATNADIRASITRQLVDKFDVQNIIFEKVAFQNESQFEEIIQLLKSKNIKSWVNCPRRCIPYYQELKEYLVNMGPLKLEVNGIDWGLACNSVHQIDFIAFLSNESVFTISNNQLEDEIFPSKRSGFIEFYGSFSGNSKSGNQFNLICLHKTNQDEKPSLILKLSTTSESIIINESIGKVEFYKNGVDEPYKTDTFAMKFQSELTNLVIEQITKDGISSLTSLEESYLIHKPFLGLLRDQYFKINHSLLKSIPIT